MPNIIILYIVIYEMGHVVYLVNIFYSLEDVQHTHIFYIYIFV